MLYHLVDEVCAEIDQLDVAAALPWLQHQILGSARDTVEIIAREHPFPEGMDELQGALILVSTATIGHIKSTARLARELARRSKERTRPAAQRCALAGILAYLVQPHDLVPDDQPGGYGFVDDAVLLRAGHIAWLDALPDPATTIEQERDVLNGLIGVAPPQVRPQLLRAVASISHTVQLLSELDAQVAEAMLLQFVGNPLYFTPMPPRGPIAPVKRTEGHWHGGAYFQSDNIIIPGGPSLVDGELYIPN